MRSRAFLLVVFLSFSAFGQQLENQLVNDLNAIVAEEGSVGFSGQVSELRVNFSLPGSSARQQASYSGQFYFDAENNSFGSVSAKSPPNPFFYRFESRVHSSAASFSSLPASYSVPSNLARFLSSSSRISTGDQRFRDLAAKAAANSTDDFERISKLAIFANQYIGYDASLAGQERTSLDALSSRRGVCIDYSLFFAALARSMGFPTRIVSGYAVSDSGEWLGHAWNEVFIGEWVPVDATWLEVGFLDATHIEMLKSQESTFGANLTIYSTPGTAIDWKAQDTLGASSPAVKLLNVNSSRRNSGFNLSSGASALPFGGATVAWLEFSFPDYRVVESTLEPCKPAGVVSVSEKDRFSISRPSQKSVVVWKVSAGSTLDQSYIYSCPLLLNSPVLEERPVELKVRSDALSASVEAWLSKPSVIYGSEQTVFFRVSSGSPSRVGVASSSGVSFFSPSPAVQSFSFTPSSLGENKVFVFTDLSGVEELGFGVAENASLAISGLSFPQAVVQGGLVQANFTVFLDSPVPANALVKASFSGQSSSESASFNGSRNFSLSVPSSSTGSHLLVVSVESGASRMEERGIVNVIEPPSVSLDRVSYSFDGDLANATLYFVFSGSPKNAVISSGGQSSDIDFSGSARLVLEPGIRNLTVSWKDETGTPYSRQFEVSVPSKPIAPCIPAVIILIILVPFLFFAKGFFKRGS